MRINIYLLLAIVVAVGAFFRLHKLDKVPVSLNWDEVSIGYNAYSLLKTGRDEFGVKYPIFIEAFGEFKTAIPSYLSIPFIKFLGLNELSIRLPTALISIFVILATFCLAKTLTKDVFISLVATILISISPWAIHFSRFTSEGMIALTFMLWGLIFWFNSNIKTIYALLSSLFLVLAIYTYHNARLFIPLYLTTLIIMEGKFSNKNIQKKLIIFFISGFIFCIPFILSFRTNNPILRAQQASIFRHKEYIDQIMEGYYKYETLHMPFRRLFNNKLVLYGDILVRKYLEHFSLEFLFLGEEISPRLGLSQVGKIYLVELPFLIYGFFKLLLSKNKKLLWMILFWIIFAPLASTLTFDSPHSARAMVFLPILQIITAYGFVKTYRSIKKLKGIIMANLFTLLILILLIFNFAYYLHFYYIYYPEESASFWQDGYKEMLKYVYPIGNQYQNVIISVYLGQPHIFFAFWNKYPPSLYQKQRIQQGKSPNIIELDNFIFKEIDLKVDLCKPNDLIISRPHALDKYVKPIKTIYLTKRYGINIPVFDISETRDLATSASYLKDKPCRKL